LEAENNNSSAYKSRQTQEEMENDGRQREGTEIDGITGESYTSQQSVQQLWI